MKSVGDDNERLKRNGQAKRPQVLTGNKDCQALGPQAPELVVIDEIVKLLSDGGAAPLVSSGRLQLFRWRASRGSSARCGRLAPAGYWCCSQVDRDATRAAKRGQSRDVARSRHVHIQHPAILRSVSLLPADRTAFIIERLSRGGGYTLRLRWSRNSLTVPASRVPRRRCSRRSGAYLHAPVAPAGSAARPSRDVA
jgi:hypothetical protein